MHIMHVCCYNPQHVRPGTPLVLAGHVFHEHPRQVLQQRGEKLAASMGALFFEVCAKTNENITEV